MGWGTGSNFLYPESYWDLQLYETIFVEKKTSCKITLIIYVPEWTHVIAPINKPSWMNIILNLGFHLAYMYICLFQYLKDIVNLIQFPSINDTIKLALKILMTSVQYIIYVVHCKSKYTEPKQLCACTTDITCIW